MRGQRTFHLPLFIFTVTVPLSYASFCGTCQLSKLSSFDGLMVTNSPVLTTRSPHVSLCARECLSDDHCVSFHFNDGDLTCSGYPVAFSSTSITSTTNSAGTKLYHTCQGDHQLGALCSQASDCSPQFTECAQGVCACLTGYEFSDSTLECELVTTTTVTPTVPPFPIPGCYEDRNDARILPNRQEQIPWYSINNDNCASECLLKGYQLAGTENGSECYCGDALPGTSVLFDDSECRSSCAGNSAQKCGGANRISVFRSS